MPVRRLGKVLGIIGVVLLVLVVVASSYAAWTVRRSFPQTSGELTVSGLTGTVDVLRDERGIPHLYADTPEDLFFAQGYVHAQDRFYEMDFRRHITSGRLSEMFGTSQVETDTFLRVSGWYRVAEKEIPLLSADTRRNLDSYTKGVNAYLADHSGAAVSLEYAVLALSNRSYTIEPWTSVDSVAWLKAMAWDLRGNMQEEIERSIESSIVGQARTAQLFPPYPYLRHRAIVEQGAVVDGVWQQDASRSQTQVASKLPSTPVDALPALLRTRTAVAAADSVLGPNGPGIGSNSWVVSGDKTASGKPLLANDPHLALKITTLHAASGVAANIGAVTSIFGATGLGVPISTTHAAASSVAGAGVGSGMGINLKVVGEMVLAWIITLPTTIVLAFGIFKVTQLPGALAWIAVGLLVVVVGSLIVYAMMNSIKAEDVEAELLDENVLAMPLAPHPHLEGRGPAA